MNKQTEAAGGGSGTTNGNTAGTIGSAIGLSTIATFIGLCCIGPWAVALFGITGAVTMARFDFLRPYILTTAIVMLAWAFWRVYRPQLAGTCTAGPSIWLKSSLWIAVILTATAIFAEDLQWWLIDATPEAVR